VEMVEKHNLAVEGGEIRTLIVSLIMRIDMN